MVCAGNEAVVGENHVGSLTGRVVWCVVHKTMLIGFLMGRP